MTEKDPRTGRFVARKPEPEDDTPEQPRWYHWLWWLARGLFSALNVAGALAFIAMLIEMHLSGKL